MTQTDVSSVRTVVLDDDSLDFAEVVTPGPAAAAVPEPARRPVRAGAPKIPPPAPDGFLSFCNLVQQYASRLRGIATSGGTAETQAEELAALVKTAEQVFQLEERLMRLTGFRGQSAHITDHKALKTALEKLIERLSHPRAVAEWRVPEVLERWVERHQRQFDGPLESHLKVISLIRSPVKSDEKDKAPEKGGAAGGRPR